MIPNNEELNNEGGQLPENWVNNMGEAENERGDGITGRERGVRY